MNKTGIIYGVNGPVIYLKGDPGFKISEMVYVGPEKLVGEVIGLKKGMTTVQVFEETTGLKPGDTVMGTGDAISVLLGPGIIHNIFDGIQRPLEEIAKSSGKYISRGVSVDSLDTAKKWDVHVTVKVGDMVSAGTIIAETQETASILHKSMAQPSVKFEFFFQLLISTQERVVDQDVFSRDGGFDTTHKRFIGNLNCESGLCYNRAL